MVGYKICHKAIGQGLCRSSHAVVIWFVLVCVEVASSSGQHSSAPVLESCEPMILWGLALRYGRRKRLDCLLDAPAACSMAK